MKVIFLVIGKTEAEYLRDGIMVYEKRLVHYLPFENKIISELKNTKNLTFSQIKEKEGALILAQLKADDYLVLLDERGKQLSSVEFSKNIENRMASGIRNLVYVVGGAYGFSEDVYQRANEKISLSKMTFSHQMVRLIFVEQLYRAMTIIKGEPYHHE
jgi:23S rRNA (pseudouridine1915-N3)-methyltransferase